MRILNGFIYIFINNCDDSKYFLFILIILNCINIFCVIFYYLYFWGMMIKLRFKKLFICDIDD